MNGLGIKCYYNVIMLLLVKVLHTLCYIHTLTPQQVFTTCKRKLNQQQLEKLKVHHPITVAMYNILQTTESSCIKQLVIYIQENLRERTTGTP